jgi:hypothetical protein
MGLANLGDCRPAFGQTSLSGVRRVFMPPQLKTKQVGSLEFWGLVYSSSKDDLDTCVENTFVPPLRSTLPERYPIFPPFRCSCLENCFLKIF